MEKARNCKIVTLAMSDMVRQIETAVQFGYPVILQARARGTRPPTSTAAHTHTHTPARTHTQSS